MTRTAITSHVRITQIGSLARACLTPGQRGEVLAVFSKAIYLLTKEDDLFWITSEDAPIHRRGLMVPAPLPRLTAGSPFRIEGHHLVIGPDFFFELANPSVWHPPGVDSHRVLAGVELDARTHSFFYNLNTSQAKGFGTFIPLILSSSRNDSFHALAKPADPVLLLAQPIVLRLVYACLGRDDALIPESVNALIGLGSGLTPCGDDFIGGLFFAFQILRHAYPGSNWIQLSVEPYSAKTNFISFTLLRDLAHGHALAPLHSIVNALLGGDPFESIYPFISELIAVGNSTGWDLLAGLLTGFLTACQDRKQITPPP